MGKLPIHDWSTKKQLPATGIWEIAAPLPFYGGWWRFKPYRCACGRKWQSERAYEAHYIYEARQAQQRAIKELKGSL